VSGLTAADQTGLIFLVIIVLVLARRTYTLSQGTQYSAARVFGYGGFSTLLFAYLAASTIYIAYVAWGMVALALIAPYLLVVVGAALLAEPRVRRRVTFEEREGHRLYYRLPIIIPLLSLVLFVGRVSVEIGLFGLASITSFAVPTTVSTASLAVLILADLLYGSSIGLLYGRGLGVRAAFLARSKESDKPLAT
jgi:hypothetical protein